LSQNTNGNKLVRDAIAMAKQQVGEAFASLTTGFTPVVACARA